MTPLEKAINEWAVEARKRCVPFDFALLDKRLAGFTAAVRPHTAHDMEDAIVAAHAHVGTKFSTLGKDYLERIMLHDPQVLEDAKIVELLARSYRNPDNPDEPMFPSAQFIRDHFTGDQIGIMLDHHNAVVRQFGGRKWDLDDAAVESLARKLAAYADSDAPDAALSLCAREFLVELAIRLGVKLSQARTALAEERASDKAAAQ